MGYYKKEHCSNCDGSGRVKKYYNPHLDPGKWDWATCLKCEGTGIVNLWHEPGIEKVWDKPPTIQEIEKCRQQEAENKNRMAREEFERTLKRLEAGANIKMEEILSMLVRYAFGGSFFGAGLGFIIGLGGCIRGSSWSSFKLSIFYCILIGLVVSLAIGIYEIYSDQNASKDKLNQFKKEHNIK